MAFNLTHTELKASERSVYSQAGQDGVLETIFEQLGIVKGFAVEFGGGNGFHISNTAYFTAFYGWNRLLMDAEPLSDFVKKEFITRENINDLIEKYGVIDVDLLCVDINGNEYWVWEAIKDKHAVVTIEFNSKFRYDESYAIEYNPNHKWEGDDYYGASLLALKKLGERKGYTLVHIVGELDAVFLRNDLIDKDYVPPKIEELLPTPIIAHEKVSNKRWVIC